ncbi:MAG: retropepsin-like aspartic protease [Bacteroidales bacterium]
MRPYIPFELVELEPNSYHILVNASINDTPIKLIVDTGASRSVIDKQYDPGIRIDGVSDNVAVGFTADNMTIEVALIPNMFLENFKFAEFPVALADLSSLRDLYLKMTEVNVGGLLGCDFLVKNVTSINFQTRKIFFKKDH